MILVIGYGNPLRNDDSVGHVIVEALENRHIRGDVRLMTVYQLMPELVDRIHAADYVIFVDAGGTGTPGDIRQEQVTPAPGGSAFTHHFTPATLLGAARGYYGACPPAVLVSVTGSNFEYGETLSPFVRLAVPLAVLAIEEIIRQVGEHAADRSAAAAV